jgi:tyrosine-protein kinase Etk/Wzc
VSRYSCRKSTGQTPQLSGVVGLAGVGGLKNSNDVYIGMLQSRTIANRLIEKFSLKKIYGTTSQEQARQRLLGSTTVKLGKDGLIDIEVIDTDKKLVAPLANAYVAELGQLTKVLAISEASQRRVFYERQLEQAKDNLAKAEGSLKSNLESRGVISVDVESQALLETAGRLRAQISAKEIELNSMTAFVTTSNPQFKRVEEQLASVRAELGKLENGRGATNTKPGNSREGFENIKLLRDLKYYQMLYEILAKQYEAARLEEAKDPTVIQVLDPAVEPERKFKPQRALIVAVSTMLALIAAIGWVFASEAYRKSLRPQNDQPITQA